MSNLYGTWITNEQATDPDYWVSHLRHTVRFADNLRVALGEAPTVVVELGPGQSLSSYARRCAYPPVASIPALRHPRQQVNDTAYTLNAFAQQWATGIPLDLDRLIGSHRRAVTLPTYAFQRQRFWIDPPSMPESQILAAAAPGHMSASDAVPLVRFEKPAQMWWRPGWTETGTGAAPAGSWRRWWIIDMSTDGDPIVDQICSAIVGRGAEVRRFAATDLSAPDADRQLADHDGVLIVGNHAADGFDVDAAVSTWLDTGITAARLLGGAATASHRLAFVSRGAFGIEGKASHPVNALALGVAAVAPHEYPDLDTLLIDADPDSADYGVASEMIADELTLDRGDRIVAHRANQRFVPALQRTEISGDVDEVSAFVAGGTYLLTGGLGAIGHTLALHLASLGANLVIVTSSELPAPSERPQWIRSHGPMEPTSQRLRRLAELESFGSGVEVVVADLARPAEIIKALDHAESVFGRIDGAVHAAGTLCDRLIGLVEPDEIEAVVGVKARGAITLTTELARRRASLLVLVSSTSTELVPAGQVAYVASNAVLDSLAGSHGELRVVTLNYGVWSDIGMAQRVAHSDRLGLGTGEKIVHPVFEELIRRDATAVDVVGHMRATDLWVLDDHRTADGRAVLPGTGHLELLTAAVELSDLAKQTVTLDAVTIHQALVVPDDTIIAVRAHITSRGDRRFVELESDGGSAVGWRLHTSAEILNRVPLQPTPVIFDHGAMRQIDPLKGQRDRLRLGPRWQFASMATIDGPSAHARLELSADSLVDSDLWRAHPALVDAATGIAAQLVRASIQTDDLLVPISYDSVTLYGSVPPSVNVSVRRHEAADGRVPKVDLQLFSDSGECIMSVEGLQLWPVAGDVPLDPDDEPVAAVHVSALAQLAESLGIRPDEGVVLLEQLLASGLPRLIASSVELDQLRVVGTMREQVISDDVPSSVERPTEGTTVIARVGAIWEELLGVSNLGPDDNFFDLGGHSLIAIRLMSRLQRELGVRLQLTDIFEAASLGSLSELVEPLMPETESTSTQDAPDESAGVGRARRSLVQISSGGSSQPLFIVHGAGGNVLFLWSLARALSGDRAVYGFQAAGVDSRDMPDHSIEEMAARYVGELRADHAGPYLLGGYSGGGLVTLEMARQLVEIGERVTHVLLFDSVPPGCTAPPLKARMANLYDNYRRLGWQGVQPWFRRKAASWYRRMIPQRADRIAEHEAQDRALGHTDVDGYVNLFYYFSATAERYQPTRYRVDVTVFKADYVWPVQPYDYYWSQYVDGSVDLRSVPGDHHSMFYPEYVPQLAHNVMTRLAEIEPTTSPIADE